MATMLRMAALCTCLTLTAGTTYFLMDVPDKCKDSFDINYLYVEGGDAYINAGGYSYQRKSLPNGCHYTFNSFADWGFKYMFLDTSEANYINDPNVTLTIHGGTSRDGPLIDKYDYTVGTSFPADYQYTDSNFITVVLSTHGEFINYRFSMYLTTWNPVYNLSVGAIAGISVGVGILAIIVAAIVMYVVRAKRRRRLANSRIANPATPSGVYPTTQTRYRTPHDQSIGNYNQGQSAPPPYEPYESSKFDEAGLGDNRK